MENYKLFLYIMIIYYSAHILNHYIKMLSLKPNNSYHIKLINPINCGKNPVETYKENYNDEQPIENYDEQPIENYDEQLNENYDEQSIENYDEQPNDNYNDEQIAENYNDEQSNDNYNDEQFIENYEEQNNNRVRVRSINKFYQNL